MALLAFVDMTWTVEHTIFIASNFYCKLRINIANFACHCFKFIRIESVTFDSGRPHKRFYVGILLIALHCTSA